MLRLEDLRDKVGSGGIADVYAYNGKAVKVFKPDFWEGNVFYEAALQSFAYRAGLPVPRVYDVLSLEDRKAIVMDYAAGDVAGDMIWADLQRAPHYIDVAAELHMMIHSKDAHGMPHQKDRLWQNIAAASALSDAQRHSLLDALESRVFGDMLCHGDFHVYNLIETPDGVIIIDWIDASRGSPAADVCRSYLLYVLSGNDIAEPYVRRYCEKSGVPEEEVYSWLPLVAAARLAEHNRPENINLLLRLADGARS